MLRGASHFGLLTAFSLALVAAGTAFSGTTYYLEQKVTSGGVMGQPGTNSTTKLWLSDTAIRSEDDNAGMVTIVRSDSGKVILLNPKAKTYSELTAEQVKALAEMGTALLAGKGDPPQSTVTQTEETMKIAGYTVHKVLVKVVGGPMPLEMTMWLARDLDLDMTSWMNFAGGMGMRGMMGDAMEKLGKLKGFPLRQETRVKIMGMESTMIQEVTTVETRPNEPSIFEVPAGYAKSDLPMPGMAASPPSR